MKQSLEAYRHWASMAKIEGLLEVFFVIFGSAKNYLTGIELFDIFRDKDKVGENKKSYAINLKLRNKDKTLVDKEIDKIIAKIVRNLQNELNANIRG